ncbi:cell wall hydrolase [Natribacillus halophilus]|uniref:N-acetylmuramoyl-L-alanine amidase n=1 Tax=Natribacillus halophilus TaxID=549003 RepID=A0A1G8QIH0_9BACI|nr:cell wall hydrolase [Natribacillus halophilus]SDJ04458.1 N-acetylmuramoyl-L-alanine amidase [Natribacillus halophilus]
MNIFKILVLPLALFVASTSVADASEATHEVGEEESIWSIGVDYGVPTEEIKELNGKSEDAVETGEHLEIPSSVTEEEKDLLARIIQAEAQSEPYAGKVGVGTVVLNRVADEQFPDSIHDVIYETAGGHYQFSPVLDGSINEPASERSEQAAREALAFDGQGQGSVYFYNPVTADVHWNATREETITLGDHVFSR